MAKFDVVSLTREAAGQIQQTTEITREDGPGAGSDAVAYLIGRHPYRDVRIFDAKRATEATADFRVRHFDDLDAHRAKQVPGLRFDAKLA